MVNFNELVRMRPSTSKKLSTSIELPAISASREFALGTDPHFFVNRGPSQNQCKDLDLHTCAALAIATTPIPEPTQSCDLGPDKC